MELEIEITGAGSAMQGVGRVPDGRAAFVPGALPGELVLARVAREKERYVEAELLRVVRAAPGRVASPCPHAGACGGCACLHMEYDLSLALKRERVAQALCRLGGVPDPQVDATLGMRTPFRARNKAEYAIAGDRIGMRPEGKRNIVEISDCLTQHPRSVAAMALTRQWLAHAGAFEGSLVTRVTREGEVMCVLSADRRVGELQALGEALFRGVPGMRSLYACRLAPRPAHALDGACQWVRGERALADTLCGMRFALHPQSFFQVNPPQAEKLYRAAIDMAGLTGRETVADAYCGAGTITLMMATRAKSAVGIEIVPQAVEDARENARSNGVDNVRFVCADAAAALPKLFAEGLRPDVVVLDPPRKGVEERLTGALLRCGAPRIVYVSCDPGTLARDVRRLSAGYRFMRAQPVDMFPWSAHVESVCLLEKA